MRIGLLSDSHGDAKITRKAMELLAANGAELFIHCGDLCSDSVIAELAGYDAHFVFGNCDDVGPATRKYVQSLDLPWPDGPFTTEIAGKRIGVCHGHESAFRSLLHDDTLDYLFHGHSHIMADTRGGHPRVINPGALYRAEIHSAVVLDLKTDVATFFDVDRGTAIPAPRKTH